MEATNLGAIDPHVTKFRRCNHIFTDRHISPVRPVAGIQVLRTIRRIGKEVGVMKEIERNIQRPLFRDIRIGPPTVRAFCYSDTLGPEGRYIRRWCYKVKAVVDVIVKVIHSILVTSSWSPE